MEFIAFMIDYVFVPNPSFTRPKGFTNSIQDRKRTFVGMLFILKKKNDKKRGIFISKKLMINFLSPDFEKGGNLRKSQRI